jgi:hypothetical protein
MIVTCALGTVVAPQCSSETVVGSIQLSVVKIFSIGGLLLDPVTA